MKPNEIEQRIKSKKDFREFMTVKKSLYVPPDKCTNTKFFLDVLEGRKRLLGLNEVGHPTISRLKHDTTFDKENLYNEIKNREHLLVYLPEVSCIGRYDKEFLITIIYAKDKQLFYNLYNKYKDAKLNLLCSERQKKIIQVVDDFKDDLKAFLPSNNHPKSKTFFYFKKNQNNRLNNNYSSNINNDIDDISLHNLNNEIPYINNNLMNNNNNIAINTNNNNNAEMDNNIFNNKQSNRTNNNLNLIQSARNRLSCVFDIVKKTYEEKNKIINQNQEQMEQFKQSIIEKIINNYDHKKILSENDDSVHKLVSDVINSS